MYLYHFTLTAQTAEWKERLPLELKTLVWFQAAQTNDCKIAIHSLSA